MRAAFILVVVAALHTLAGCAEIAAQDAAKEAYANFAKCVADYRATPESQLIAVRLWMGDGTDSAVKLVDPNPLTPAERNALVKQHSMALQCRQIITAHDNKYAPWRLAAFEDYFQRSNEVFNKLASGELPVGLANRLSIESNGKLQADLSGGQPGAVRGEEAQRQQAAEAMLQASTQIAAYMPKANATHCAWLDNTLNCTSLR